MQPSSLYFAIFLGVVTVLYFSAPQRFRWLILIAASCCFYMSWGPTYIIFIAISILINFYIGLIIDRNILTVKRKTYLIIGILINLLPLLYFKYLGFLLTQFDALLIWIKFPCGFPLINIPPPQSVYLFLHFKSLRIWLIFIKAYEHTLENGCLQRIYFHLVYGDPS